MSADFKPAVKSFTKKLNKGKTARRK